MSERRPPSHHVLVVTNPVRKKNDKPYFKRIGAAWPSNDGNGFNIQLFALPLDGFICLREPLPDDEPEQQGRQQGAYSHESRGR